MFGVLGLAPCHTGKSRPKWERTAGMSLDVSSDISVPVSHASLFVGLVQYLHGRKASPIHQKTLSFTSIQMLHTHTLDATNVTVLYSQQFLA